MVDRLRTSGCQHGVAVAAGLAEADANMMALGDEGCLKRLVGYQVRDAQLLAVLGEAETETGHSKQQWIDFMEKPSSSAQLRGLLSEQEERQTQNLTELREALASSAFFHKTVATLQSDSDPAARSCSVCLEEALPLKHMAITPCAHTFCIQCLRKCVACSGHCSICRQSLVARDVVPVAVEVGRALASQSQARCPKHGSKISLLVDKLKDLRAMDSHAKVILFVQFDDLIDKVSSALSEFGIPNARLRGSVANRGKILDDWQNNHSSSTFVLLLSLGENASGTNLTAASHVVFLQPMLTSSIDKAKQYELQAIGRARRQGQKRSVVQVWRFVTSSTVEEVLHNRHNN